MIAARFIISLLYFVMLVYGVPFVERRFAVSRDRSVQFPMRPWVALLRMWGPLFWVFPGALWIGLLDIPPLYVIALSFLLPLCCLIIFMFSAGVFRFAYRLQYRLISSLTVVPLIFFFTIVSLVLALLEPGISYLRFAIFVLSAVLPILFSILTLGMWAPAVVPLPDGLKGRVKTALEMILAYSTSVPKNVWVVEDGKIETRIAGNTGGAGPALLVTEPHNVVVLRKGLRISRVVGPGAVLLRPMERPFRVVDLRAQLRSQRVTAFTRDGVEVSVPISSRFRIRRGSGDVLLKKPWPYHSQGDVLKVISAEEVDPTGRSLLDEGSAYPWEDLPLKVATHKIEQAIGFYTFDQLYAGISHPEVVEEVGSGSEKELLKAHRAVEFAFQLPEDEKLGDPLARTTVGKLVRRAVMETVERQGYEVLGGGVGNVIMPVDPAVIDHQVARWRAHFMIRVLEWQADLERERFVALSGLEQGARTRLFRELVDKMGASLDSASDETRDNFVACYVMNSLLRMARTPEVRRMLPDAALPTFEQLRRQFQNQLEGLV